MKVTVSVETEINGSKIAMSASATTDDSIYMIDADDNPTTDEQRAKAVAGALFESISDRKETKLTDVGSTLWNEFMQSEMQKVVKTGKLPDYAKRITPTT